MSFTNAVKSSASLANKTFVTTPQEAQIWSKFSKQASLKLTPAKPAVLSAAARKQNVKLGAFGHQIFKTGITGTFGTTQVPDFSDYRKESGDYTNRNLAYFMVGSTGFISAAVAKNSVHEFLTNLSASADVLAMAKAEVDLTTIPEGKNPVFIRHRTQAEINEANNVNIAALRDPQTDADRTKQPEWLVMLGICTHLGCVPVGESGEFGGWYCPCHGSHYDISGRIRKGPAPLNLEIPQYEIDGDQLVIG
ncbi:Rieske [2Fe-2S] iron-sulfur domain-containing protein [Syncephalis pseudoplumigaleata]|uniref:Cytochrome b-c1 complex subunit Rieske, mitochondrial n=1 Tax=Syncephalis pseudoplumigaleata TaxID=1712513 RepID=A0A4P9YYE9_9FUNG|nr:Rieske [2Fe-2S] iron-sulfur domain-containing protein [Syncephalis pseudoplumigaleata]|eukprot:RKP25183.1 Rieske [2Fe-2S] iron-sulfur domain-containing protein [Syncephalis pseudoplumigaleata]